MTKTGRMIPTKTIAIKGQHRGLMGDYLTFMLFQDVVL